MTIKKENVEKAIKKLDDLSFMVGDWRTMELALFIWQRYGTDFVSELAHAEETLEKMSLILENHETLFDEYLLEEIEDTVSYD